MNWHTTWSYSSWEIPYWVQGAATFGALARSKPSLEETHCIQYHCTGFVKKGGWGKRENLENSYVDIKI
jgi:hypothetical protein